MRAHVRAGRGGCPHPEAPPDRPPRTVSADTARACQRLGPPPAQALVDMVASSQESTMHCGERGGVRSGGGDTAEIPVDKDI